MSERHGLLPLPSNDICALVTAARPSESYIDGQFFTTAIRNFAISDGLEELSSSFRRAYDSFCGELLMFSGVQVYRMLDLAAQHAGHPLPVSTRAIADVIRRSLEEQGTHINETYNRLKEDNPPIHGYMTDLCKLRNVSKRGPPAFNAIIFGGIFAYSMLELQADADKMAKEFK